jgi:hypothetical protein
VTPESLSPDGTRWVLLAQREAPDVLYEAAAMTASAASLGISVTVVWYDGALAALAGGRLDEAEEASDPGTFGAAGRLFGESRATGLVRFLACSASARTSPGGLGAARERVDDVVGWPTVIGLIRTAEKSFIW